MNNFNEISTEIQDKLGLKLSPVGLLFADKMPADSVHFKKKGLGCIVPMILKSAEGKVVAFDDDSTGLPCSSFYLGYSEWIFPGIEKFLSNESVFGREPERFLKDPPTAKAMVEYYIPEKKREQAIIFKPLSLFEGDEKPEIVIFFANADQLAALVYLVSYNAPLEERIVTPFASACMSMFTIPIKYASEGKKKAVWGFHDIAARRHLPKELMSFTMTYDLFMEVYTHLNDSFIQTENWERLRNRNRE